MENGPPGGRGGFLPSKMELDARSSSTIVLSRRVILCSGRCRGGGRLFLKPSPPQISRNDVLAPKAADDSANAEEGSQRQLAQRPTVRSPPRTRHDQQGQPSHRAQDHTQRKGEKRAGKAQPCGQKRHQFGVT